MKDVRIGAAQFETRNGDKTYNLSRIRELTRCAVERGAERIIDGLALSSIFGVGLLTTTALAQPPATAKPPAAARQAYSVTAVDSSQVGLDKARKLAEENAVDIEFIHSDLEHYDLGHDKWDGIVSIFCNVPPNLRKTLHAKIINGLKHQGILILEAYTPDQLKLGTGGPPVVDLMMDADSVEQELPGLRFEHLVEVERHVQEGFGHHGTGAVVQIIGYKN